MRTRKSTPARKTMRQFPRHQQLSDLSLTYEGSNQTLRIHPLNISTKGMFVNTSVPFPEGSILKLNFRLARTGTRIAARCEVRYCLLGAGLGVEFIDLSRECARAIQAELGRARLDRPSGTKKRRRKPHK